MPASHRILIAEASPLVRDGLRSAVEDAGMTVPATCATAAEAVAAALALRPEAILISAALPGGAVAAMEEIRVRVPATEIVAFADRADAELMLRVVRAGAHGLLLGEADPVRLPHALAGVIAGETAFPRRLVRVMADELARTERRRRRGTAGELLTEREADVLGALADGEPPAAVAARLGISDATVRRHVANAMRRLGVGSRAEAIRALRGDGNSRF